MGNDMHGFERAHLEDLIEHPAEPTPASVACRSAISFIRAALAAKDAPVAGVPAGWKLVPVDPTKAMRRAGADVWATTNGNVTQVTGLMYRTMLSAAPQPQEDTSHQVQGIGAQPHAGEVPG